MIIFKYFAMCIIAKILIQDRNLGIKDGVYFALTSSAFIAFMFLDSSQTGFFQIPVLLPDAIIATFTFIFIYKVKAYPIKKAIILATVATVIANVVDFLISFSFYIILPGRYEDSAWFFVIMSLHFLLLVIFAAIISGLVVVFSKDMRAIINQNNAMQTALVCTVPLFVMSFFIRVTLGLSLDEYYYVFALNVTFFTVNLLIGLVALSLSAKSFKAKTDAKQRELVQNQLELYTEELERQQLAIRKFKHDYQNILASLKIFISDGDLEGLARYYTNEVEVVSKGLTQASFALDSLQKIKVKEIKGILATKMMQAQNAGTGITVRFEASDEINHIPIDSIALVRMLGIILDNAIDELTELNGGMLLIGCFKRECSITFIVTNTCKPNITNLHQFWQKGFSTRGEGRGLGLSNLLELVDSQQGVMLETDVEENTFTQRLIIPTREEKGD